MLNSATVYLIFQQSVAYVVSIGLEVIGMFFETTTFWVDLLSMVLGLFFLIAGARKLYGWEWAKNGYLKHSPLWVYYLSAVVELVSGIGLILPPLKFTAVLLLLLLILCISIRSWQYIKVKNAILPVTTTLLLLLLLWLTRP
jgi:hypothetical protein